MGSLSFAQLNEIAKQSDVSFEVLPKDKYLAKVVEVGTTPAASGKDMFTVKFEVTQGPRAGAKIWNRIVISPENPNAVVFLFKNLAAFGITQDVLQHEPSIAQIAGMMQDRLVWLDVIIKPYNGEDRNEVKSMSAYQGGEAQAMSPASIDPFAKAATPVAPVPVPTMLPFPAVTVPVAPEPQTAPAAPPVVPPTIPPAPPITGGGNDLPSPPPFASLFYIPGINLPLV